MKSKDVMTKDPACCVASNTVLQCAEMMKTHDVGSMPIVESEGSRRLVGILTDRDIVVKVVAEGLAPDATPIGDVMSREPVVVRPDEELDQTMERMKDRQVRRVPVVDEQNRLVGIIAQADVATHGQDNKKTGEMVREISEP
jgi:CBS domain-containing protein